MSEVSHENKDQKPSKVIQVGLISPIARIDDLDAQHWINLRKILQEALNEITEYKFELSLVSNSESSQVIIGRIIENIFHNDIVICDASCLNPNVMFELGLRLSTQKPTILIKDTDTRFIFDTGMIEHVEYPRSLHYTTIQSFKASLANKVLSSYKSYLNKTAYKSFLDYFGRYNVSNLKTLDVNLPEYLDARLSEFSTQISHQINGIRFPTFATAHTRESLFGNSFDSKSIPPSGLLAVAPSEGLRFKIAEVTNAVLGQYGERIIDCSIDEVITAIAAKIPESYRLFSTPSEIDRLIAAELSRNGY